MSSNGLGLGPGLGSSSANLIQFFIMVGFRLVFLLGLQHIFLVGFMEAKIHNQKNVITINVVNPNIQRTRVRIHEKPKNLKPRQNKTQGSIKFQLKPIKLVMA